MIVETAELTVRPDGLERSLAAIRGFVAAVAANEPETFDPPRFTAYEQVASAA